jgi:hypothetical protein
MVEEYVGTRNLRKLIGCVHCAQQWQAAGQAKLISNARHMQQYLVVVFLKRHSRRAVDVAVICTGRRLFPLSIKPPQMCTSALLCVMSCCCSTLLARCLFLG